MKDADWSNVVADGQRMEAAQASQLLHDDPPEFEYPDPPECDDPAYIAYLEEQHARGDMAFEPETMPCYECGGFDGVTAPEREVVKLGPVVNRADPTQTYVLACGHTAM